MMLDLNDCELSQRIERLEKSVQFWRIATVASILVLFAAVPTAIGIVLLQRKAPPQTAQAPAVAPALVNSPSHTSNYANFCRVTSTPEELVLDFGLNTQVTEQPQEPLQLSTRLVLNFYSAKRLQKALQTAVQQHENTYGELEIDVQKRMLPGARPR